MDSKGVKEAVMRQVLTESNVANARVLLEVRFLHDKGPLKSPQACYQQYCHMAISSALC
jgi:hypothetical protein